MEALIEQIMQQMDASGAAGFDMTDYPTYGAAYLRITPVLHRTLTGSAPTGELKARLIGQTYAHAFYPWSEMTLRPGWTPKGLERLLTHLLGQAAEEHAVRAARDEVMAHLAWVQCGGEETQQDAEIWAGQAGLPLEFIDMSLKDCQAWLAWSKAYCNARTD